jgi:hypothetical protein
MGEASRKKRERRQRRNRPVELRVVEAACAVFPQVFRPDCCINGTWVIIETLRRLGVEATPMACMTSVFNPVACKLVNEEGALPKTMTDGQRWKDAGAHIIEIAEDSDSLPGYPYHVVAVTDSVIIDGSAGQFVRLKKQIDIPEALAIKFGQHRRDFEEGQTVTIQCNGSCIIYKAVPEETRFRNAEGWGIFGGGNVAAVAALINKLRA